MAHAGPSEVIVTAGGKQAMFEALAATVSAGDEVIVPSPWWVSYPQMVRFCGGRVVPLITCPAHDFRFDPGDFEALITPRTQWLLLNSPGNPTGAVYPAEMLLGIAEVLRRHPRVLVLSDDIYAPADPIPASRTPPSPRSRPIWPTGSAPSPASPKATR